MKSATSPRSLRTPRGYQILKLEVARPTADHGVRPGTRSNQRTVFTDKREDEYEKYLDKLRAQAIIDWKNDDVKKAYDDWTGEAADRAATQPTPSQSTARRADAAVVRRLDPLASRAGRARAARTETASRRFFRRSRAGAAGRIARRRSTGRCFPATASRDSIPSERCRS